MALEKRPALIKRGQKTTMPKTGHLGEPRFTTDTKEFFINDGDGNNILLGSQFNIKYKGDYNINITYDMYDLVEYNEILYLSLVDNNLENIPENGLHWRFFLKVPELNLDNIRDVLEELGNEIDFKFQNMPLFTIGEIEPIPVDNNTLQFWFDTGSGAFSSGSPSILPLGDIIGEPFEGDEPPVIEDNGGEPFEGGGPPIIEDNGGEPFEGGGPPVIEDNGGEPFEEEDSPIIEDNGGIPFEGDVPPVIEDNGGKPFDPNDY